MPSPAILYILSSGTITKAIDPTPEQEAAARAKEAAEQAALPYKWEQTIADLDITITIPGNLKARDLVIEIKKQKLKAGIKGQDPIIDVCPRNPHLKQHLQAREDREKKSQN